MANKKRSFVNSISPNQNYVFYEYLRQDGAHSELAENVRKNYASVFVSKPRVPDKDVITKLRNMAQNERKKEQDFIQFTFGVNINYDLNYSNTKDFIDAFNSYMQLQSIYEARKTLLMHGFGNAESPQNVKELYTFFSSYFATEWNQNSEKITDLIMNRFYQSSNRTLDEVAAEVIKQELPNIVHQTLIKMEKVQPDSKLSSSEKEQVELAMQEMYNAINRLGKTTFGNMIISALSLNSISKNIAQDIRLQQKNNTFLVENMNEIVKSVAKYYSSSRGVNITGGNMLELIENVLSNQLQKTDKNFQVFHTGNTGMKADNIMISTDVGVNFNQQQIEKILNDTGKSQSRQENIDMINRLQSTLEKGNSSGYIVYSSAKSHFMVGKKNGKSEETGFSGGTQKLSLFAPILDKVATNSGKTHTLIQGIMQTIPGAIGENDKDLMEDKLAEYFAYFLFDDIDVIGQNTSGSKFTQIHLMNLDGVYVPLSVLLSTYADALNKEITKITVAPESVAKIKISTPKSIKYNYADPNFTPEDGMWAKQRDEAFNGIKVSITFLKSLRTIMSDFER